MPLIPITSFIGTSSLIQSGTTASPPPSSFSFPALISESATTTITSALQHTLPFSTTTTSSSNPAIETITASILSPLNTAQTVAVILCCVLVILVAIMIGLLAKTPYLINNYPTTLTFILKDLLQIWGQVKMIAFAYKSMIFKTTVIDVFEKQVNKQHDSIFLIQNDDYWTYGDTNKAINRLAHIFKALFPGIKQGSTICLMMESVPEYIMTWHAILKLGCIGALLNIHIAPKQLAHCIETADPIFIISDQSHLELLQKLQSEHPDHHFSQVPIVVLEPSKVSSWLLMDGIDIAEVCDVVSQQGFSSLNNYIPRTTSTSPSTTSLITPATRQSVLYNVLSQHLAAALSSSNPSATLTSIDNDSISVNITQSNTSQIQMNKSSDSLKGGQQPQADMNSEPTIALEEFRFETTLSSEERGNISRPSSTVLLSQPLQHNNPITEHVGTTGNDSVTPDHSTTMQTESIPTSLNSAPQRDSNVIHIDQFIQSKIIPHCLSLLSTAPSSSHNRIVHYANSIFAPSKLQQAQTGVVLLLKKDKKGSAGTQDKKISSLTVIKNPFLSTLAHTAHFFTTSSLSHSNPPSSLRSESNYMSTGLLIYTSGTTGMPKAAILRHSRIISSGDVFIQNFGIQKSDRLYTVLPLYHSAGGVCSSYAAVLTGASLVIKKKLSTRDFWKDCQHYNITIIQYIGELCRYLLNTTPTSHSGYDPSYEKQHNVRMAFGNGLRSDVWLGFQERFNIPTIAEFYASTEGNVALFCLYNRENRYHQNVLHPYQESITQDAAAPIPATPTAPPTPNPAATPTLPQHPTLKSLLTATLSDSKYGFGSVGHNGPLTKFLSGFTLIKYDIENDLIIKDPATGYAIECDYNEPGLLVAPIINWDPVRRYGGYYRKNNNNPSTSTTTTASTSSSSSPLPPQPNANTVPTSPIQSNNRGLTPTPQQDSKILTHLFKQNDQYFNTGDILTLDEYGYWRFSDRIGDTFRWKSENVSTQEVEAICAAYTQPVAVLSSPSSSSLSSLIESHSLPVASSDLTKRQVFETVNSYGIEIPGQDGRCCMIAVTLLPPFTSPQSSTQLDLHPFDFAAFYQFCARSFSSFSQPSFIRFIAPENKDNTGTFKLKKAVLRQQGAAFYIKQGLLGDTTASSSSSSVTTTTTTSAKSQSPIVVELLNRGDVVFSVRHDLKTFVEMTPELWEAYIAQTARL